MSERNYLRKYGRETLSAEQPGCVHEHTKKCKRNQNRAVWKGKSREQRMPTWRLYHHSIINLRKQQDVRGQRRKVRLGKFGMPYVFHAHAPSSEASLHLESERDREQNIEHFFCVCRHGTLTRTFSNVYSVERHSEMLRCGRAVQNCAGTGGKTDFFRRENCCFCF